MPCDGYHNQTFSALPGLFCSFDGLGVISHFVPDVNIERLVLQAPMSCTRTPLIREMHLGNHSLVKRYSLGELIREALSAAGTDEALNSRSHIYR